MIDTLVHTRNDHDSDQLTVHVDNARRSNTDFSSHTANFLASFGDEPRISIRSHDDKDSRKGNNKDNNRDDSPPPNQVKWNLAMFRDSRHHKREEIFIEAVGDVGQLGEIADA